MELRKADVLVVGSGGAGVTAAVEAAKTGAKVLMVSKEPIGYGDTRISLGVMSMSPDVTTGDSEEQFIEDMIRGGEGLNDRKLVQALVSDALDATLTFEGFGHIFQRNNEGILHRLAFPPGGHSASRAIASPAVGISMGHTMRAAAARSHIEILEETLCAELLVNDGEIAGATLFNKLTGESMAVLAKAVILASGGAGSLYYPHTDCMPAVVGDSYGLALGAGAELVDMEQVQFLPFGITHPSCMLGAPCGEPAMAGPFGRLLNAKGDVVLEGIMPMTRAQVARIIVEEIRRGGATEHGGLLLDLRPNIEATGGELFLMLMRKMGGPFLDIIRRAYGQKASDLEIPWDVLPTVHYNMGGVKTDEWCRSRVPGLYACGQAQGGVMGGNRLGSTSLTEIFVFGKRAGKVAAAESKKRAFADEALAKQPVERVQQHFGRKGANQPVKLKRVLQKLMWEKVGPLRDATGLTEAAGAIGKLKEQAKDLQISTEKIYNTELVDALELGHMLATAEAITLSALERRESRGAHVREDFPERDDNNPVMNMVVSSNGGLRVCRAEVAS
jgi:succinate dehydrogenase/fumarate reductase flavoprotein subunit